jgi:hypothetical protein
MAREGLEQNQGMKERMGNMGKGQMVGTHLASGLRPRLYIHDVYSVWT